MCHNPDGVASGTRLHFPDANASPAEVEVFGNSLGILVDRANPSQSLLIRKPTNRIPHSGGERIKPGSPEEAKERVQRSLAEAYGELLPELEPERTL